MDFYQALITVTLIHLLAAASPGPDFVMVTQQSLIHGRRAGLLCSLGIALGLSIHIIYSSAGLAVLISQSSIYLVLIKYLAAAYLIYLGINAIASKPTGENIHQEKYPSVISSGKLVAKGFLCNAINPKAPLYFLSLFSLVLSPELTWWQLIIMGSWLMLIQFSWFALVALILSKPVIRKKFQLFGHWFDRLMGSLMLGLGLRVLFSESGKEL